MSSRMHAWLLVSASMLSMSSVDAQVGSRGAVEVRRENDQIPPPPEETDAGVPSRALDDAGAQEVVDAGVTPSETTVDAAAEAPAETPAIEVPRGDPEPAPEAPEVPETERELETQPQPDVEREPDGASDEVAREPATPSESTTLVLERGDEPDPIVEELQQLVTLFGRDRNAGGLLAMLLWFALAAVATEGLRRLRARFPSDGLIPNLLAVAHLGMRLVVIALALSFVVRALPPRLSLVMLLAFAGLAVAIGWSLRDVMPDLVASLVIAFERRIRRGVWVSGRGFAGHVERLGLRAALLYDAHGNRVMVPNREIVRAPVTAGVGEFARELEVELRIEGPAEAVRAAIRDAVLTSPWVHPQAQPVVLRDPADPTRWRVRGRLLEASFGARFEGELLERVEALLRKEA